MTDDLLEENVDVVHAVLKEHALRYGLRPAKKSARKVKKDLTLVLNYGIISNNLLRESKNE